MADPIVVSAPISATDRHMTFEAGKLAPQAHGAVVGKIGDTTVLVTATASRTVREGADFFPLTVDIEERMYAAGKIPGSFFRREGRASDQAILTCRLIDRPLRPSFADDYRHETHIVGTILGVDRKNPHDVISINAASAALMLSGLPFHGPIGAVRIAYSTEGDWIPHPTWQEGDASTLEMVVAGRLVDRDDPDGEVAIMMVEAGGTERAWDYYEAGAPKVTEQVIADGLEAAKTWIREAIVLQLELVRRWEAERGPIRPFPYTPQVDYTPAMVDRVREVAAERIDQMLRVADKAERNATEARLTEEISAELAGEFADDPSAERHLAAAVRAVIKERMRDRVVNEGVRIDGRSPTDIRPLSAEVGVIATAHGSALFERGETQVLNVATLGMPRMEQMLDTIWLEESKRYMHHYNFPPFSTGETGFMRGPRRREIGHGLLAERAVLPVVPHADEFPYTLRLVSEVLSSNGSTSMASVCASSLSLMDAGVPIKAPVAGIAMGLIHHGGTYVTLTDILGAEDFMGDMDFKVAGTADFVTALQLDTKLTGGIPAEVLASALEQARQARLTILEVMRSAIAEPRPEVRPTAPKIVSFEIPIDKIGEVIGPKGKVINTLQQETGAEITVDDDGVVGIVSIGAADMAAVEEARRQIELIVNPPQAEVGRVYEGKVVNITKFGAFVNILPGRDGLVHISKLGGGKRIERVEDVLQLGQALKVRVDDIDPQGKVALSPVEETTGDGSPAGDGADGEAPEEVSFSEAFEAEVAAELGGTDRPGGSGGGEGRPRRRRRRRRSGGSGQGSGGGGGDA